MLVDGTGFHLKAMRYLSFPQTTLPHQVTGLSPNRSRRAPRARSAEGQGQLLQGVEGFLRALDGETLKPLSWELPLAQQLRAKADRRHRGG